MRVCNQSGARRLRALLAVLLVVGFAWAGRGSAPAQAAPPNTMTLAELALRADANGAVPAYFKTVLKGDTVVDVSATVRAVVPRMNPATGGALILFAVDDSQVLELGGIAQGMSGSPLFVKVEGRPDQLVGAVSYGDTFTRQGLGLATPIHDMVAISESYLAGAAPPTVRAASLSAPVVLGDRSIERVVVAPSLDRARRMKAAAATAVFAPLTAVQIGGLDPRTAAYKTLAARLEARGLSVLDAAQGTGGSDPARSSPLVGGASLGMLYARGDLWVGAAGTVTYVDGDRLLGFGHPLEWLGPTQAYLTNGWVAGVWGSSVVPYKLIAPTALRGSITEDRGAGVAGRIGLMPADTVVASSATFNGRTLTSTSVVTRALASTAAYSWLPAEAAAVPVYRVLDQWAFAGSAQTTSTVVVSDGVRDYTVTRTNVWDDPWDVSYRSTGDLWTVLTTLTADPDGVAPAIIKSVRFEGTYDARRDAARIVGLAVPGGLRSGANDVRVTLAVHGVPALQTVHVTLTVPPGTPLRGSLEVMGVGGSGAGTEADRADVRVGSAAPTTADDRRSVAELVEVLNELPLNNDLVVTYRPEAREGTASTPVEARASTDWFVSGSLQLPTSSLRLNASPKTIRYGSGTTLFGTIEMVAADTTVDIYATPKGSATSKLIATVPAPANGQTASFEYHVAKLKTTTRFTAVWSGDSANLGSTGRVLVTVRPRVAASVDRAAVGPEEGRFGKRQGRPC